MLSATSTLITILLNTYQQLLYAQAFVFKTFHIVSPVLTSLSHENTIDSPLTSKKSA